MKWENEGLQGLRFKNHALQGSIDRSDDPTTPEYLRNRVRDAC